MNNNCEIVFKCKNSLECKFKTKPGLGLCRDLGWSDNIPSCANPKAKLEAIDDIRYELVKRVCERNGADE